MAFLQNHFRCPPMLGLEEPNGPKGRKGFPSLQSGEGLARQCLPWLSTIPSLRLPPYRGTSLTKTRPPLGPYCRPMPRVLWGSWGGGRLLMSEVPLYIMKSRTPPLDHYGALRVIYLTRAR